jgi:hypothetical protein
VLVCLLLCMALALYSCGSGGGGGSSSGRDSGATTNASLFITDNLTADYQQVIVTVYKVELVKSSSGASLTAFEDALGITYDLRELSGVLETLSLSSIPPGRYNRVNVTVGEELMLVDNNGMQINPNPVFDGSGNKTTCSAGKCVIEVTGAVNIISKQNVVLDFDLKQFKINTAVTPNTVTAKIVLDANGAYNRYHLLKQDGFKLKGIIDSLDFIHNRFDVVVIKAKNFVPPSNIVTVNVDSGTMYGCDDDDNMVSCPVSAFGDLAQGMKVEIRGTWDGTTQEFDAVRVELDQDDDIAYTACTIPNRSITDFSGLTVQPMIEQTGGAVYVFDNSDYSVDVAGKHILITKETVMKDTTGGSDQHICADQIPSSADEIEVRYYAGVDSLNNSVFVAYKIEFRDTAP